MNIRLYLLCCLACIADFIFHELINLVHYNKLWRLIMWISAFIYCCYKPKIKILNRNLVPKTFSTLLTEKTCPGCLCRHRWKKYWGNQVEQADTITLTLYWWSSHCEDCDSYCNKPSVHLNSFSSPLILRHWPIDCILSGWCVHKVRHVAILWFFFSSDEQFTYQIQLLIWNTTLLTSEELEIKSFMLRLWSNFQWVIKTEDVFTYLIHYNDWMTPTNSAVRLKNLEHICQYRSLICVWGQDRSVGIFMDTDVLGCLCKPFLDSYCYLHL